MRCALQKEIDRALSDPATFPQAGVGQSEALRLIDRAHPAAAELAGDAVVRDGLVDHVWLLEHQS